MKNNNRLSKRAYILVTKDHNGNKRSLSLSLSLSLSSATLGGGWQAIELCDVLMFYLYLLSAHNILIAFYCFAMYVANM